MTERKGKSEPKIERPRTSPRANPGLRGKRKDDSIEIKHPEDVNFSVEIKVLRKSVSENIPEQLANLRDLKNPSSCTIRPFKKPQSEGKK
jgi:hypothetical protein